MPPLPAQLCICPLRMVKKACMQLPSLRDCKHHMPLENIEQGTTLLQHPGMPTMGAYVGSSHSAANEGAHSWHTSERLKGKLIQVQRTRQPIKINRYLRHHFGIGLFVSLLGPLKRCLSADELTFMVSNGLFKMLSICASTVQELLCFSSLAALSIKLSCTAPAGENQLRSSRSTTCADFSSQILPVTGLLSDLSNVVVAGV